MFNQPLSGNTMPRCGGIATMMRLPFQNNAAGLDAAFVGVPFDIGTSNRPGNQFVVLPLSKSMSIILLPPRKEAHQYNKATLGLG